MHRDVRRLVVAQGEAVVAAAACREAVVALDPAGVPAVARDPVLATAVRIRLGAGRRQVARHEGPVVAVRVVLVLAAADVEAVPVLGAAGVEVRGVGAQPSEVVVEGTVLHDEHHDRVDRCVRRRTVEQAVGPERDFRGAVAFVVSARREQRAERDCAGAERARCRNFRRSIGERVRFAAAPDEAGCEAGSRIRDATQPAAQHSGHGSSPSSVRSR